MRRHCSLDTRTNLSAVDRSLKQQNMVHLMAHAERSFANERYTECAEACYNALREKPSEAIQARCHMYLATEAAGPTEPSGRAYHAAKAIDFWNVVIARTGYSRFPIPQAKLQLDYANHLFKLAQEACAEEEEPLPMEMDNQANAMPEEQQEDQSLKSKVAFSQPPQSDEGALAAMD